jgi:hypothetical protein
LRFEHLGGNGLSSNKRRDAGRQQQGRAARKHPHDEFVEMPA